MEDISMRGAVVRISQDSMEAYLTLQPPERDTHYQSWCGISAPSG